MKMRNTLYYMTAVTMMVIRPKLGLGRRRTQTEPAEIVGGKSSDGYDEWKIAHRGL